MNWSSVKNLLIAILVAANAFLIFNVARQDRTRGYIPEAEAQGAAELLSERGLSVPKDIIPLKKFDAPVYESVYSDEYYTKSAELLTNSTRDMLYTLPGGGISISTEDGSVVEFDTEFGFRYASEAISDADAYTKITAGSFFDPANVPLGAQQVKSLSDKAEKMLSSHLSDDSPLGVLIAGSYTDGEMTYLLARQVLDGHEVYSHFAVCAFLDGELVYAHGRWYFFDVGEDYSTDICDQVSILFTDLQTLRENGAEPAAEDGTTLPTSEPYTEISEELPLPSVTAIKSCYATYWNADKTALYFIPAWQIDHNNSLTIVYNATNSTIYVKN